MLSPLTPVCCMLHNLQRLGLNFKRLLLLTCQAMQLSSSPCSMYGRLSLCMLIWDSLLLQMSITSLRCWPITAKISILIASAFWQIPPGPLLPKSQRSPTCMQPVSPRLCPMKSRRTSCWTCAGLTCTARAIWQSTLQQGRSGPFWTPMLQALWSMMQERSTLSAPCLVRALEQTWLQTFCSS